MPKGFILILDRIIRDWKLEIGDWTNQAFQTLFGLGVQFPLLQFVCRYRVLKEIRHFGSRHGRIYIGEIRDDLPAPGVEHIERHGAFIQLEQSHHSEQFILGVERTEGILQLGKRLHGRCPYSLRVLLLLQAE